MHLDLRKPASSRPIGGRSRGHCVSFPPATLDAPLNHRVSVNDVAKPHIFVETRARMPETGSEIGGKANRPSNCQLYAD